jgi:hypothetical protein
MTRHIAFFRDGSSPPELINHINNLGGALITDPRPDLRGDFIVTDVVQVNLHATSAGWAATAILRIEKYMPPSTIGEVGAVNREAIQSALEAELASVGADILN